MSFSGEKKEESCGNDAVKFEVTNFGLALKGKETEETFFVSTFRPADGRAPKVLICLNHGFAEYISETYHKDLIPALVTGLDAFVFAHDHLGHGRSTGARVQTSVDFISDYVDPVIVHCKHWLKEFPDIPLFVLGHSMGGLISLMTAAQEPELFKGIVLMAPLVEADPSLASPTSVFLAKWLSFIFPSLQVPGVKKSLVTRNTAQVERCSTDELNWSGGLKIKNGLNGLKALDAFTPRMPEIKLPIFIQQGTQDKIVRPEGAKKLFEAISSEDKELKEYEGAFHNMFIELDEVRDVVIQDEVDWLKKRIEN